VSSYRFKQKEHPPLDDTRHVGNFLELLILLTDNIISPTFHKRDPCSALKLSLLYILGRVFAFLHQAEVVRNVRMRRKLQRRTWSLWAKPQRSGETSQPWTHCCPDGAQHLLPILWEGSAGPPGLHLMHPEEETRRLQHTSSPT